MSGPTWPPPKTPGSPERPVPQMSDSGPAVYRQPPKKVSSDTRPKYVVHDQNRGGGGMATRYLAKRSTAGPMQHHHQKDPGFHPKSIDHYYQPPPQRLKEDQSLNPHMDRYQLMHQGRPEKPIGHHSIIDDEIDSLTCMLDDLDSYSQNSTQLYDNVPYNKHITGDRYKPSAQPGAPSQGRLFMGLPPHRQHQYRPTPPFPRDPLYFTQPDYADAQDSKPYPQPVTSSYTTASTTTRPRISVQDKTAHQTVPHGWYPSNPASQAQELHSERGYKGSAAGSGGRVTKCPTSNRGTETKKSGSCSVPSSACQPSKTTLERCSKCSKPIRDHILRFMGKAYHPCCFNCVVCGCCLDGVPFTLDATSQIHCLDDFHRKFAPCCSVCGQAIMPEPGQDAAVRIVALDRSFHVNCYVCEECGLRLSSEVKGRGCYPFDGHILCKGCSAQRIQDLSANISTDC
ncbi:unnamed protein product [Oncorhynchus mykiss]|uniref:Zyxin n=1 Tax=Oncorhynchus mykiss TaxID=8022 RepID=A0A060W5I2_ONCMY|nr:unnamed protein product [Oncorhynchus mykiss]